MDEDAARKVAVSIAQRAAMRVFPYVWEWSVSENSTEVDVTSLPVLRCLLIAASSCFEMTHQSKKLHIQLPILPLENIKRTGVHILRLMLILLELTRLHMPHLLRQMSRN